MVAVCRILKALQALLSGLETHRSRILIKYLPSYVLTLDGSGPKLKLSWILAQILNHPVPTKRSRIIRFAIVSPILDCLYAISRVMTSLSLPSRRTFVLLVARRDYPKRT